MTVSIRSVWWQTGMGVSCSKFCCRLGSSTAARMIINPHQPTNPNQVLLKLRWAQRYCYSLVTPLQSVLTCSFKTYFISRSISLFQLFLLQVTSAPVFAALSTTSAYNPTPLPELTNLDVVKGLGAEDVTKALERQLFNFPPSVTAAFTGEFYLLDKEEQPLLLKPNVAWSRDKSQSLRLQKSCVRTRLSSPGSSLLR